MGPFDIMKPWSITGVEGVSRFLSRLYRIFNEDSVATDDSEVLLKLHQTIKKVTNDLESYKFNTAISTLMEFSNLVASKGGTKETKSILAQLIAPFAPHLCEEVWVETLGQDSSVHASIWPKHDEKYLKIDQTVVIIQVNGKLRHQISLNTEDSNNQSKVESLAKGDSKLNGWLVDKEIKKVIFVPGKLINFVI
jgi:leucyl-tRNA synthetase